MSKRPLDSITVEEQRELCKFLNPNMDMDIINVINFDAIGKPRIEAFADATDEEIAWFESKGFEIPEKVGG